MIELTIVNKNNDILLSKKGDNIDCIYECEYKEGDKIVIHHLVAASLPFGNPAQVQLRAIKSIYKQTIFYANRIFYIENREQIPASL